MNPSGKELYHQSSSPFHPLQVQSTIPLYQSIATVGGIKPTKSDMCLINELVRGLSLRHEYRLVSESGPAHKKQFTVSLRLGDLESYDGTGPSIKKAQQAAASRALKETKLSHSLHSRKKRSSVTPTVELNVYAMKQGIQVSYVVHEPRSLIPADGSCPPHGASNHIGGIGGTITSVGNVSRYQSSSSSGFCSCVASNCSSQQLSPTQSTHSSSSWNTSSSASSQSPSHLPSGTPLLHSSGHPQQQWNNSQPWYLQPGQRYVSAPDLYQAIVTVGTFQFSGTGRTPQGARHSAAQAALDSIHSTSSCSSYSSGTCSYYNDDGSSQASTSSSMSTCSNLSTDQRPVIVSLLKKASELNLVVDFQVVQNLGPSHLPTFVTQCTVGKFAVQSQGHSKKESKKKAASDMLALLNQIKIVPNGQIAPSHGQQVLMAAAAGQVVPIVPPNVNGHLPLLPNPLANGQVNVHHGSPTRSVIPTVTHGPMPSLLGHHPHSVHGHFPHVLHHGHGHSHQHVSNVSTIMGVQQPQ